MGSDVSTMHMRREDHPGTPSGKSDSSPMASSLLWLTLHNLIFSVQVLLEYLAGYAARMARWDVRGQPGSGDEECCERHFLDGRKCSATCRGHIAI